MQSVEQALANLEKSTDSRLFVMLGELFQAAGHELSLVGGPVRDAFLGRKAPDLDFTTSALPDETIAILKGKVDAHWDIGREFGTIGARIGDDTIEITTYRADKYDRDSRKPEVAFGKDLTEDLLRRDFTVNAMAVRLPGRELEPALQQLVVGGFDGLQFGRGAGDRLGLHVADLLEGEIPFPRERFVDRSQRTPFGVAGEEGVHRCRFGLVPRTVHRLALEHQDLRSIGHGVAGLDRWPGHRGEDQRKREPDADQRRKQGTPRGRLWKGVHGRPFPLPGWAGLAALAFSALLKKRR